jgi:RNA polymerase sigma factor (TIGR02999 family)
MSPSAQIGGNGRRTLAERVECAIHNAEDVTGLLVAWGTGDTGALERLMPIVYDELRRLAHGYMRREAGDATLQATALVNEAYVRLVDLRRMRWQNRAHFFAMSATLMRRILVDAARARTAKKRGDGAVAVELDEAVMMQDAPSGDVLAIDAALDGLAAIDARKARVVELRYFAGLTVQETAEALHVSPETVMRDWKMARSWLARELRG